MSGATQSRVRRTMLDAGGYWRPLAAVARLLEELGELSELLATPQPPQQELAGELADLWIITTALGDQYLAEVAEPPSAGPAARGGGTLQELAETVTAAGEIARVVNYYDGPKTPRTIASLPTLAAAASSFHGRLGALASTLGVDLGAAVDAKLDWIRATDMERFERWRGDPSTAPVLERLRAADPASAELRLWGAPESDVDNALRSFFRASGPERIDAFVIEGTAAPGEFRLGGWEREVRGAFLLLRRSVLAGPGNDLS